MQATLYVVGRSDDHVIKKSQSPSRKKKKKKIALLFSSRFVGDLSSYLPTLPQNTCLCRHELFS